MVKTHITQNALISRPLNIKPKSPNLKPKEIKVSNPQKRESEKDKKLKATNLQNPSPKLKHIIIVDF